MTIRISRELTALVGILVILTVFSVNALADGCPNAERRTLRQGETFVAGGDKCWVVDRKFVQDSTAKDEANLEIRGDLADEITAHQSTQAELVESHERLHQEQHKKKKWKRLFVTGVVVVATFVVGGLAGNNL